MEIAILLQLLELIEDKQRTHSTTRAIDEGHLLTKIYVYFISTALLLAKAQIFIRQAFLHRAKHTGRRHFELLLY